MSMLTDFAGALLAPSAPCPAGFRAWNGSDPAARLAVYRNNVTLSLIDALTDSFPVTSALVGDAFFRAMARAYLEKHPPRTPVLALWGEYFADFIAGFPPAAALAYLPDVARLEMAWVLAYHAADAVPLPRDVLVQALSQPATLPALRFALHPSLRLLTSPFAMASIWAAHQGDEELADVDITAPEAVLVIRTGLDVCLLRLPSGAATFIAGLRDGRPLGEAALAAQSAHSDFDLSSALALLIRQDALVALHSTS